MKVLRMSHLSVDVVRVSAYAEFNGTQVDPTTPLIPVSIAVVAQGTDPISGNYVAGNWEEEVHGLSVNYWATRSIGPLAIGRYDVWIKISDPGGVVQRQAAVIISY